MNQREGVYGIKSRLSEDPVHVVPVRSNAKGILHSGHDLQQLTEAKFLAAFCCAIFAQQLPKEVCTTAAEWLYDYFGYRQAQFSFADPELQNLTFHPGRPSQNGRRSGLSCVKGGSKRSLTVAGDAATGGCDITLQLSTGLGTVRLLKTERRRRDHSADFLRSIGNCLGSSLAKALEHKRLQELALRDGLTGLLNRRAFEELLTIEEMRRDTGSNSLLMIDIDHFKSINDRFGHLVGDQVIAGVAGVIRDALRGADLAARYGGEEFCVFLPSTTAKDAFIIAERIRSRILALSFNVSAQELKVTASVGVANRCSKEECSLRMLLALADKGLYEAKRTGRNLTVIHQTSPGVTPISAHI